MVQHMQVKMLSRIMDEFACKIVFQMDGTEWKKPSICKHLSTIVLMVQSECISSKVISIFVKIKPSL